MDLDVFGFTLAVTVATSLLFGLTPAISASGVRILDALKTSDRAQAASGSARARKALVAVELGLCLILLIGAGLLTRSLSYLSRTDLGFSTDNLLTFRVNPMRSPESRKQLRSCGNCSTDFEQTPTFESVALVSEVPLSEGTLDRSSVLAPLSETVIPLNERPIGEQFASESRFPSYAEDSAPARTVLRCDPMLPSRKKRASRAS